MIDIKEIANAANLIVNGYAFTCCPQGYRVLNLNHPEKASVLSRSGEVLETSMDDIELHIICGYFQKNKRFMED